jgi:hypothetical protein
MKVQKPPEWILQYKKEIEHGEIDAKGILELENARRGEEEGLPEVKLESVKRTIRLLRASFKEPERKEQKEDEEEKKEDEKKGLKRVHPSELDDPTWHAIFIFGHDPKDFGIELTYKD